MGFYGRQRIRKVLAGAKLGADGLRTAKRVPPAMPGMRRFPKDGAIGGLAQGQAGRPPDEGCIGPMALKNYCVTGLDMQRAGNGRDRERPFVPDLPRERGCDRPFIASPAQSWFIRVNQHKNIDRKAQFMRYANSIRAALVCCTLVAAATPAAAITCEGNFQVQSSGARIATPYCQDGYLAAVAREYGARTSAQAMRWNPSEKARICRFIGDDNRVRDTCQGYRDNDRNDIWR
jgi:hypothetical protein